MAEDLKLGSWVLSHARIGTIDALGNFETIFRELGGVRLPANAIFRVRDAYAAFHDPTCTDTRGRGLIDDYEGRLRREEPLEVTVTVRHDPDDAERIYDGNKRCIALYEVRRTGGDRLLDLDVFLVEPAR